MTLTDLLREKDRLPDSPIWISAALALAEEMERQLAAAQAQVKALSNDPEGFFCHDPASGAKATERAEPQAKRPHKPDCDEYHLHTPPKCCHRECWCRACVICGKPKGQPPDGCPGHYEGTASDAKGGGNG